MHIVTFVPGQPSTATLQALIDTDLAYLGVDELIAVLLERVREQFQVDTVTVLELDPFGDELIATASLGLVEEVAQGVRLPVGLGFAGSVAARREPIQLDHVDATTVLNPLLIEAGIRSMLGVPVLASGQLMGVLHVGSRTPRRFTEEE